MKNKKIIIGFILIIILALILIDSFIPVSLEKNGPFSYSVANGIEYNGEFVKIGNKEISVFAFLNETENGKEFVFSTVEKKGILKNKYEFSLFNPIEDSDILNPSYENISDIPVDNYSSFFDEYYGSLYMGIVPSDCKHVTIDGKQAELKHFSFELNNQKADFILYYCFIESEEYTENREINVEQMNKR